MPRKVGVKKNKKREINFLSFIIAGIAIIIFLFIFLRILFVVPYEQPSLDAFSQCLTNKGARMYGADWCSRCQNQKDMFGASFQYVQYTNCDFREKECADLGITSYPTWNINGKTLPSGTMSLKSLGEISQCLPLIPAEYQP
ncbi:hypothetical protein HYV57_00035 [Candidatus Peregrinibacteria bacterium]|nr:hypothetical protein [Candidatus Peregrinibacteria bacterium]